MKILCILQYVVEHASIFLWVSGISYYIQYPTTSFAKWPIQADLLSRDGWGWYVPLVTTARMCEWRNCISNTISSSSHLSPLDTCITHITTSCQLLHMIIIMLKLQVKRASFIDFICRRYIAQGFKDDTLSHITPPFIYRLWHKETPSIRTLNLQQPAISRAAFHIVHSRSVVKIYQAGHYSCT